MLQDYTCIAVADIATAAVAAAGGSPSFLLHQ